MSRPRWADPSDDAALVDLVRRCPMHGAIHLYFDRAPSFFTLSRLQGEGARVCVVDHPDRPDHLAGAASVAPFREAFVNGHPRPVFYASDLRIAPDCRRGLLLKRLYDFLTSWGVEQGWDLGMTTVMQGNSAMAAVLAGKGGLLPYHHVATMRNYAVQTLWPGGRVRGYEVRPAEPGDVDAMVALWNRLQAGRQFAPVWTAGELLARIARSPGLTLASYRLAWRGDRLAGLVRVWDQAAFKRMVVTGYAPAMARMRRWYNPLARSFGLAGIPDAGAHLPYVYATEACAETPQALRALYGEVLREHRRRGYLFMSAMLDVDDPLNLALDGFLSQKVDIELFAMDPMRRWRTDAFRGQPAYFDPALV